MFEQFVRVLALFQNFNEVAYPARLSIRPAAPLFICPVRSQTEFTVVMHFLATDLDFDPCIFIVNNRRVQRFVAVALGSRDIILEPTGDHFVALMDDTEGPIAIFRPFRNDAEGHYRSEEHTSELK